MDDEVEWEAGPGATHLPEQPGQGMDRTIEQLHRLCEEVATTLVASNVGITVMSERGSRGLVASWGDLSPALDELQVAYGEGPCFDAFIGRAPVLEADLRVGARWPQYTRAALDHGIRAVFAFPLHVGRARMGVLDIYRDQEGGLSKQAFDQASELANVATRVLLWERGEGRDSIVPGVGHALEYRYELFQAQGMIQVQLAVTLDEAMVRLRAHAYANDLPLHEVARAVVTRRLRLDGSTTDAETS